MTSCTLTTPKLPTAAFPDAFGALVLWALALALTELVAAADEGALELELGELFEDVEPDELELEVDPDDTLVEEELEPDEEDEAALVDVVMLILLEETEDIDADDMDALEADVLDALLLLADMDSLEALVLALDEVLAEATVLEESMTNWGV
ncbi:hypothetical protein MMC12_005850 [Toensbergia leucococca]|nr:hypothetical protein [Toensbergia leucococca]